MKSEIKGIVSNMPVILGASGFIFFCCFIENKLERICEAKAKMGIIQIGLKSAKMLREKGLKVGTFRPITLFPFPNKRLIELSKQIKKFVCVEVNMGQMVDDVRLAVNGKVPVELIHKGVGAPPVPEDIVTQVEGLV